MTAKEYFISHAVEIDFVHVVGNLSNNLSEEALRSYAAVAWVDAISEPAMIRSSARYLRPAIQKWWSTLAYHELVHLTEIPDWLHL